MKKILSFVALTLSLGASLTLTGCNSSSSTNTKTISVCASDIPHAQILNGVVKNIVENQGYTLEVKTLDWTLQNDAVANKDYDANYFQHVPYLESYTGTTKLVATCKVHYEPLGIYQGKATSLTNITSVEICDDTSNAIRALQLLQNKGIITGDLPVDKAGENLTFSGKEWTSSNGIKVTLIAENLLASSRTDYDIACIPGNTALTANISLSLRLAVEDDADQASLKANVLAVRHDDYLNDTSYKAKIDVLTDALLSKDTRDYVNQYYNGMVRCDSSTQIDLRSSIK